MNWYNTCRICLVTNNTLECIYSSPDPLALDYKYSSSYSNMIQSVTLISVNPNDTLPQQICQKCINDLLTAFNFQKLTIETEAALLQSLQSPETKLVDIKTEPMNVVDVAEETKQNSPNRLKIKVEDPILTHDIEKHQQNIPSASTNKYFKIINKKFNIKAKTIEAPKKQTCQSTVKPQRIKIKPLKSLQNQTPANIKTTELKNNSLNTNKVFVPRILPPPLIPLSESKLTPPPLVFLSKTTDTKKTCEYCNIKSPTAYAHKAHLLLHEIDLNRFKHCHFCGETPRDLIRHYEEHYKYLTCVNCNKKFVTIDGYENHMKKHLKLSAMNLCRMCGTEPQKKKNICYFCEKHICRYCGKKYKDFKLFVQHERSHKY